VNIRAPILIVWLVTAGCGRQPTGFEYAKDSVGEALAAALRAEEKFSMAGLSSPRANWSVPAAVALADAALWMSALPGAEARPAGPVWLAQEQARITTLPAVDQPMWAGLTVERVTMPVGPLAFEKRAEPGALAFDDKPVHMSATVQEDPTRELMFQLILPVNTNLMSAPLKWTPPVVADPFGRSAEIQLREPLPETP
jgi:hypothetical protein